MEYDHREIFTLSDGGKIYINYMGEQFKPTREANYVQSDGKEPLFFIVPGLTSHGQSGYIKTMIKAARARGYLVVLINYRGLDGLDLVTP